jgi:hypothetical protein
MKHMKHIVVIILTSTLLASTTETFAKNEQQKGNSRSHSVKGHLKKNGTYIQPHHATNPNYTQQDNWSSKPNVNPHTGKQGKRKVDH